MTGKVKYIDGNTIFIQISNIMTSVFAVYSQGHEYYPIVAGYASTIHKVMRQTLQYVTLAFDMRMLFPAVEYVALSRVSSLDSIVHSYGWRNHILLLFSDKYLKALVCASKIFPS